MYFPLTFLIYMVKKFITWISIATLSCILLIIFAIFTEISMQLTGSNQYMTLINTLKMEAFDKPYLLYQMTPFIFLCGAIGFCWSSSNTQEEMIARASGISKNKMIVYLMIITLFTGIGIVTIYQPIASLSKTFQWTLKNEILERTPVFVTTNQTKRDVIWIREERNTEYLLIHAIQNIHSKSIIFEKFILMRFQKTGTFIERVEAKSAELRPLHWHLEGVSITNNHSHTINHKTIQYPTTLKAQEIYQNNKVIILSSIWKLPKLIHIYENMGLSTSKYRMYFYRLITQPFFLCNILLIVMTLSTQKYTSRHNNMIFVTKSMLYGILFIMLSYLLQNISTTGIIPIHIAMWIPNIVTSLVCITILWQKEYQ